MKVSLFIVLLLAVTISLCGGTPPVPKKLKCGIESTSFLDEEDAEHLDEEKTAQGKLKHPKLLKSAMKQADQSKNKNKTVSFNEQVEVSPQSSSYLDESGIFWLSIKTFSPFILEKCKLFGENSVGSQLIALIEACIVRNYKMFNFLYRSAIRFSSYDCYLCQIEKEINGKTILFPNLTEFMPIKVITEYFEKETIKLLDAIIPAYELNEHFLNLLGSMNARMEIDQSFLDISLKADEKMTYIYRAFIYVLSSFKTLAYIQSVGGVRKTINHFEHNAIDLDEANKRLDASLPKVYKNIKKVNEVLRVCHLIDFKTLREETEAFYGNVRKALKVDEASSSK